MATAFDDYYPFDTGDGSTPSDVYWRDMAQLWLPTGVVRGAANELEVYGDDSGMQVKVKTGEAWIIGCHGQLTAEKTLAIAAADGTHPRKDLVVARADIENDIVELDVITGTPAATPTTPAVTQTEATTWEIALGVVDVAASETSIEASHVTPTVDRFVNVENRTQATGGGIEDIYDHGDQNGTVTLDFGDGNGQKITADGSLTINPPSTGLPAGDNLIAIVLAVHQDSTGGHSVGFSTSVKWPNDIEPTWTTTADDADIVTLIGFNWSGTVEWFGSAGLNYTP